MGSAPGTGRRKSGTGRIVLVTTLGGNPTADAPEAPVISGTASASSIVRTASAKGPVALMTDLARIFQLPPPLTSRTVAPTATPASSCVTPVT